jgi:hypothetical protein
MRANLKRKKGPQVTRPMWVGAMVLGVVAAAGAGMLLAARQTVEESPVVVTEDTPVKTEETPRKSTAKPAPVAKNSTPAKSPATVVAAKPVAPAGEPAAAPPAAAASGTAGRSSEASTPVTVTGCLELDNQEYRLTDTEGANAPKSRSWKSGFLKKRAADLEVLDASNSLRLATHLGQRVTVSGVVTDRKMQARTLVVAPGSCK